MSRLRRIGARTGWAAKRVALLMLIALATFLATRIWDSQRGLPLEVWHTFVPDELSVEELDRADWAAYLAREQEIFDELRVKVTQQLEPEDRVPVNRYFDRSPIYPGRFADDWNRSHLLEPDGPPRGAAVLLHGLTDAPYSQRHIGQLYRDRGFVALIPRLPAHGTVPGALTDIEWESWAAATRLAVREARRRIGPDRPLHLVGFSNGGALAMKYALDALEDPELSRPDRLVLISPMIGITAFARFAGVAGWPAIFPAFAKAAWLAVLPEFIPFKYNSFPINGARQSFLLTRALQPRIAQLARENRLHDLPPVLTFQSVIDFTVSTRAIITALYAQLPENGSELVLFDLNRTVKFGPLLNTRVDAVLNRVLPSAPRAFRTTILANAGPDSLDMVERVTEAGSVEERTRPLDLRYRKDVFSLSHVALPFPVEDGLYGLDPDPTEDFGIHLGAMATRGERGALIVSLDSLLRITSNPFFPYMLDRIAEELPPSVEAATPPR
ncbi:MAG TPA: alpha/beta hydrolase [Geminicoccus sp.]|uniref:alpha/beta hydrolase n=1 Tax=Geminicoccus sp. TaxID=2024832 RepID=UPI002C0967CB|nr:alpha/beta hydrolase [Geminicoccus sp.]HWL68410.1 alpha/beta hydrolase [Geminicoccus sp.]